MMRRMLFSLLPVVFLCGCVEENWLRNQWTVIKGESDELPAVTSNPHLQTVPIASPNRAAFNQASLETAARVDTLGRQILAANQQLGIKPLFVTIGGEQPEVFHVGTSQIFLTDGLVKKCASEGQLAAVLCHELGRMVSARESLAGADTRTPERTPPQELRVGNDRAGGFGEADQVHRAELAKFEKERRYTPSKPAPPPNPRVVAEACLYRAGHNPKELDAIAPLLQEASTNRTFSKQLTGTDTPRAWTR